MTLLKTIQKIKREGFTPEIRAQFSADELKAIRQILHEVEEKGFSDTLSALWANDFEQRPIGVDQFLEDDYYLGKVGKDIYPAWRKDLQVVLAPTNSVGEWILEGGIGTGKTFCAVAALVYKMYYLSCLANPQKFHGLAEGSPIIFGLFNVFKYLAQATSYQYLITWLRDLSPYFRSLRIIDPRKASRLESDKQVLHLPKNIGIALGSTAINALGQNLFGGLLDEAEFGRSKSITSQDRSQIADLYHNVRTRMDSRFLQQGGNNPGLLCLVSSARDVDSFLSKHVEAKREDPHTHFSNYALYEVKDRVYAGSKRFKVVVGDKLHQSFILDDEGPHAQAPADARVVEVPVEFMGAFRYDIDTALRDIAGVKTYGKRLFFNRRDMLLESMHDATPRRHPFKREEIAIGIDDDTAIEDYLVSDELAEMYDRVNRIYRPRFYPFADRYIHVDLSERRDRTGIAMSCVSEIKNITRYNTEGVPANYRDYVHFVDFMLRIRAIRGSEIDFAKIRRFIFYLIDVLHFRVASITYDSYQSTDSIQIFKKEKLQAAKTSVDKTTDPYYNLRAVVMERRFDCYYYEPFFEEFTKLEDHSYDDDGHQGPTIDHPHGGSKDVSDAVCGSVSGAIMAKGTQIAGNEASEKLSRAKKYVESIQEKVSAVEDEAGQWIQQDYQRGNPLEDLFNNEGGKR